MDDAHESPGTSGFTALELLVALALAAVIAGIAIPALQDVRHNSGRLAAVNAITSAIWFARNTAMKTSSAVLLCKADEQRSCSAAAHGDRWIVTHAPEDDAFEDESPARPHALRTLEVRFSGQIISNRSTYEFLPLPRRSSNGTILFCDARGGHHQRAIVVSYSGRPRLVHPQTEAGFSKCPG